MDNPGSMFINLIIAFNSRLIYWISAIKLSSQCLINISNKMI